MSVKKGCHAGLFAELFVLEQALLFSSSARSVCGVELREQVVFLLISFGRCAHVRKQ